MMTELLALDNAHDDDAASWAAHVADLDALAESARLDGDNLYDAWADAQEAS